ncbi:DnaJ-domain-containing protein [Ceraceosorus guamensis]|uniref:DnaJ-domain-containing protein n=1 Tax=Ceraceosorus guamensis TaxID=1522189 RepID=A0A316W2J0_9BASI|nr:DnaJ-domain-containing protein [Ceraceosorus guamensis]PWN44086.1 DnaJ-domain-containing protein [Ceraceosorus guamensis]
MARQHLGLRQKGEMGKQSLLAVRRSRHATPRAWQSLAIAAILFIAVFALSAEAAKDYYKIMGVDRQADDRTIKRAYRKLAQKLHPDKHPEKGDQFVELSEAYQILSEPETRKIYDRYGEDGVKRHQQQAGSAAGNDPMNVFRNFFGGGGGPFGQQGPRRGPNRNYNLEVGLEDMYRGRRVSVQHQRNVICAACDGSGAREKSDIHSCEACGGQGIRVVQQQIMPGFVTRSQVQCDRCGGQGQVIQHLCSRCNGQKVTAETVDLDVEILPGAREGEEILFEGDADEGPDFEPGDVSFKLRSVRHKGDFRRRDNHLYTTYPISLADALLGFDYQLRHMDDHNVTLRRTTVTQPGWTQTIKGEGMPKRDDDGHGDLFVEYQVVMPDKIEGDIQTAFEKIFARKATRGEPAKESSHSHEEL